MCWQQLIAIAGNAGHCATIHAATIGDNCLIGMGATVLDGAKVGGSPDPLSLECMTRIHESIQIPWGD